MALVGYTSAGKSTLLNALCQAEVLTDDILFATIDPTTRHLTLPDKRVMLITDTVGFIKKLPPTIISAFQATLDELTGANLLLHVVDLASPDALEQCRTVENVLRDLKLSDISRIAVLNKIDLLLDKGQKWDEKAALNYLSNRVETVKDNMAFISATKKWGLARLPDLISEHITGNQTSNSI
jgi:GTP-binding protein HflX